MNVEIGFSDDLFDFLQFHLLQVLSCISNLNCVMLQTPNNNSSKLQYKNSMREQRLLDFIIFFRKKKINR